jgi:hypothetical protein
LVESRFESLFNGWTLTCDALSLCVVVVSPLLCEWLWFAWETLLVPLGDEFMVFEFKEFVLLLLWMTLLLNGDEEIFSLWSLRRCEVYRSLRACVKMIDEREKDNYFAHKRYEKTNK